MTPLHGIACFYDVGFGARAVSGKTPIYFTIIIIITIINPNLQDTKELSARTSKRGEGKIIMIGMYVMSVSVNCLLKRLEGSTH